MKNLEKNNIHAEEAIQRDVFRAKVLKMEGVQGRREKNVGSKWTEDRKKRHSEKTVSYTHLLQQVPLPRQVVC